MTARIVALAVAFGALLSAQTSTGSRLVGRVVDAGDARQPIRRAIVTLSGSAYAAGRSVVTDDEGRFAFEQIPAGEFTLTATRAGFIRAAFGATRPGRAGTPLSIKTGKDITDLVIPMTHGSALAGVVRDSAGDPSPGMRVEAIHVTHRADGDRGQAAGAVLTDDRGEFRIFGLPPGDYVLVATAAAIISGIGDIGAPSEAEVDAILATLPRRSPAATAPAGPGSSPPVPSPATPPTPARKGFSTPAVFYPGVFQSSEAMRITLGVNDSREGLDFQTRLSHSADIDGVIVAPRGQAVPQLQIAIRATGSDLPVFGGASAPMLSMRPAEHTFHVSNVPPGRYRISARTFGAPGSQTAVISGGGGLPRADASADVLWATADVEMGGDDVKGVSLALQPALKISGRLTFAALDHAAPTDLTAAKIALEPIADAENGSNGLTSPIPGVVQANGAFIVASVVPGRYRLTVSLPGWWARSAIVSSRDVLDGGLVVGSSDVPNAVVTLTDRPSSIGGAFSTADGRPASAYFLVAFATDRTAWRAPSRRVISSRPNTDGSFELRNLPAGSYFLAAVADLESGDLEDATFLESLVPTAIRVTLGEGERKRQDIKIGG